MELLNEYLISANSSVGISCLKKLLGCLICAGFGWNSFTCLLLKVFNVFHLSANQCARKSKKYDVCCVSECDLPFAVVPG